jgi:hypothetical protein
MSTFFEFRHDNIPHDFDKKHQRPLPESQYLVRLSPPLRSFGLTDAPWGWILAGIIALLIAQGTGLISFVF